MVAGDRLVGHNTDTPGFDRFLRRDAGFDAAGRSALVLGAGGAARAVALALALGGAASVRRRADPGRADDLLLAIEGTDLAVEVVPFDEAATRRADLVVNATPVGADGRSFPPIPVLGPDVLVIDLLYRPVVTPSRCGLARRGRVVRRTRTAPASGRAVVRAVDRHPGAARRDVGGGRGHRVAEHD